MIKDDLLFNEKEVSGILGILEETEHPIGWMFRDDENGMRFVYYSQWLDEVETEYNEIVKKIFDKFCEKHNIFVEEIYMTRISLFVQSINKSICYPEVAYPNPEHRFIYFASETDMPIVINNEELFPVAGQCIDMDGHTPYHIVSPKYKNFFTMIEIEYR